MGLGKDLGQEFSDEIANTYMFLERIPEANLTGSLM